jgi:hypothetical protein
MDGELVTRKSGNPAVNGVLLWKPMGFTTKRV